MSKAKITVTIDADLVRHLDEVAARSHWSRSRLVEAAIRSFKNAALERDLIAGYRAMADDDRTTAEDALAGAVESFR